MLPTFLGVSVWLVVYVPVVAVMQDSTPCGGGTAWHPEIVVPSLSASAVALVVGFWNRPDRGEGERQRRRRR